MADIDPFEDEPSEEESDEAEAEEDALGADEGDPLILIVVGAHLRAEVGDRPLAYRMRERVVAWLREHFRVERADADDRGGGGGGDDADAGEEGLPCGVVVCSDVWY